MIITTTNNIEGKPVKEYLDIVTGETIIGANLFKDIFASITDLVGGRSTTYENVLREAKGSALQEMKQKAAQLGANAILGIDLDYEALGKGNGMLMVTASGTAVKI